MGILNKADFFIRLLCFNALGKRSPLTVIFNVTDRCNLQCDYCYADYYKRDHETLSLEEILKVLGELSKMGCKRISLSGGEPLIRKDIGEIIGYIKKRGMECAINSNGVLVPKKIDLIKGIDSLCLSLDGDEQAHDSCRGKGSFQKVIDAIECAGKYKIPLVTNTVLHKNNLHSIDFVLELAKKYGFLAEFNLSIAHLINSDKNAEYKGNDEEIKEALSKIIDYKKRGYPILFSKKAFEYSLSWPTYQVEAYYNNPPAFEHAKCTAGKYFCIFDTNGDVYPCPHLIGKYKPVNAVKEGFKKAFVDLDRHNCKACYQVYHNEFNLLFHLDFSIICNYIKNSLQAINFRN